MKQTLAGLRVVLALVLATGLALADGYQDFRAQALGGLVESLSGYAHWCQAKKLYAERDATWELVLEFDADHAEAHKVLGHRRQKDGSWKVPDRKRPPRNHDDEALALAPAERAKAVQPFSARLLAFYDENQLTTEEREALFADVLYLDPDNARVHELRDEVKLEDTWVLRETIAAKDGRARIRARVRKAYETAPPARAVEPSERERALGIGWNAAVENEVVRVVGSSGQEECEVLARALWATHRSFEEILGRKSFLPEDFTVFLLANPTEGKTFLEKHPAIDEATRERLSALEGAGIQGTHDFAHWSPDPVRRRDAIVRLSIGWMLEVAFNVNAEEGWIYEGLGLYLGRECVGTRLTWFVQPASFLDADEEASLRARLMDGKTKWMSEAFETLKKPGRPPLAQVMGKPVMELTTADLLIGYVASAYLLETRSTEEVSTLLLKAGSGMKSTRVVEKALGMSIDDLDVRISRWLSERR